MPAVMSYFCIALLIHSCQIKICEGVKAAASHCAIDIQPSDRPSDIEAGISNGERQKIDAPSSGSERMLGGWALSRKHNNNSQNPSDIESPVIFRRLPDELLSSIFIFLDKKVPKKKAEGKVVEEKEAARGVCNRLGYMKAGLIFKMIIIVVLVGWNSQRK